MIKRKTMTCCLDVKESTKVFELKKIVGGILKKEVEDIKLLKDNQVNYPNSSGDSSTFIIKIIHGVTTSAANAYLAFQSDELQSVPINHNYFIGYCEKQKFLELET